MASRLPRLRVAAALLAASCAAALALPAQGPGDEVDLHEPTAYVPWLWADNASLLECPEGEDRLLGSGRRLWRITKDQRRLITATRPTGLGYLYDLAPYPDGSTFVATSYGIFLLSPDTQLADAVDIRDGVPRGRPVGLQVDDRGVLWIATENAFGCMDADQFFGRTFNSTDGLDRFELIEGEGRAPRGAFTGFAVARDGGFLLHTPSQVFAYSPGHTEKPVVSVASVNGQPHRPGQVHQVGESLRLKLDGKCDGTPTFRYRLTWQLEWLPIPPDARIGDLRPGEQTIEVVAYDRELHRSDPVRVTVAVPYPLLKRPAVLVPAVGLAELLGIALVLRTVRRRGRAAWLRGLFFAVLMLVVGGQTLVGVFRYGRADPFQGFWMYVNRTEMHGVLYKLTLMGIRPGGAMDEISPLRAGGDVVRPFSRVIPLVHGTDEDRRRFVEDCNRHRPDDPLVGVQVQAMRWRLTQKGPVQVAPVIYSRYELPG